MTRKVRLESFPLDLPAMPLTARVLAFATLCAAAGVAGAQKPSPAKAPPRAAARSAKAPPTREAARAHALDLLAEIGRAHV